MSYTIYYKFKNNGWVFDSAWPKASDAIKRAREFHDAGLEVDIADPYAEVTLDVQH